MINGENYLSLGEIRNRRKDQNKEYYRLLDRNKKARIEHTKKLFEEVETLNKLTKELLQGRNK